jgi:hypothetical protein
MTESLRGYRLTAEQIWINARDGFQFASHTIGKGVLEKAFKNSVKAMEARQLSGVRPSRE